MWPFKKSVETIKDSGVLRGATDWHSHILPGVDDGIKTLDDSLQVLSLYEKLGIKKVWLTPHIMEDYPNEPQKLKEKFEQVKAAWTGGVEIALAAENMLDSLFEERMEAGNILTIGDKGSHILVETSYFNPPMGFQDIIDSILSRGYFPVLAHPERYQYMDKDDYEKLKEKGVLFQINYTSLAGGYGETARKKSEWLLQQKMVDMVGSDVHRLKSISTLIERAPRKKDFLNMLADVIASPVATM